VVANLLASLGKFEQMTHNHTCWRHPLVWDDDASYRYFKLVCLQ